MPALLNRPFHALRLWSLVAVALMLAGAVTALGPQETADNPVQSLYSGAI